MVDNGSSENRPVEFDKLFPEIIFIKSDVNVGFAKGNNLGIAQASGDYILLLNSDCIITDPQTFIKAISKIKSFDDKAVLTTKLLTDTNLPQVTYGYLPSVFTEFVFTSFVYKMLPVDVRRRLLIQFDPDTNRVIEDGYITATFLMFRAEALDRIEHGRLYDDVFLYGEEGFWSTQFRQAGYFLYYYADVSIIHLVGRSSSKSKIERRRWQTQGEDLYLKWRFGLISRMTIYFLRMMRFTVLSPFDKDIRLRRSLLLELLLNKSDGK